MHKILIALRKKRGLSAKELSKRLGYSETTILNVEHGKKITAGVLSAYNKFFCRDFPDKLELTCYDCGKKFVSPDGLALFCPRCLKSQKKCCSGVHIKVKEQDYSCKYNPNPITRDTVMIICMFHLEGQTVKQIASHLSRPLNVVEGLLKRAMRDGRYKMYQDMKNNNEVFYPGAKVSFGCVKATKQMSIKEDTE